MMSEFDNYPDPFKELRDEMTGWMLHHPDPRERRLASQLLDLLAAAEFDYRRQYDEARMGHLPDSAAQEHDDEDASDEHGAPPDDEPSDTDEE